MPLFRVTAPDGTVYQLEGPEGTTQDQLIAAVEASRAPQKAPPAPAPETTYGGYAKEIPKAVGRGLVGLLETAGVGASALLPESLEESARAGLKEYAGMAKDYMAAAPGYEDKVVTKLSEGVGSTIPFLFTGPFGLAGRAAAVGLGATAGMGEARERAEQEGATKGERAWATTLGAPVGLLDTMIGEVGTLTRVFGKELGPIKSLLTTALARGGVEGATEAAQKIAQNAIAKNLYNPSQAYLEGSGEEGAYGAGVGVLTSLLMDMTLGRKHRAHALQEQDKRINPPAPPAPPTMPQGLASLLAGSNNSRLQTLSDEELAGSTDVGDPGSVWEEHKRREAAAANEAQRQAAEKEAKRIADERALASAEERAADTEQDELNALATNRGQTAQPVVPAPQSMPQGLASLLAGINNSRLQSVSDEESVGGDDTGDVGSAWAEHKRREAAAVAEAQRQAAEKEAKRIAEARAVIAAGEGAIDAEQDELNTLATNRGQQPTSHEGINQFLINLLAGGNNKPATPTPTLAPVKETKPTLVTPKSVLDLRRNDVKHLKNAAAVQKHIDDVWAQHGAAYEAALQLGDNINNVTPEQAAEMHNAIIAVEHAVSDALSNMGGTRSITNVIENTGMSKANQAKVALSNSVFNPTVNKLRAALEQQAKTPETAAAPPTPAVPAAPVTTETAAPLDTPEPVASPVTPEIIASPATLTQEPATLTQEPATLTQEPATPTTPLSDSTEKPTQTSPVVTVEKPNIVNGELMEMPVVTADYGDYIVTSDWDGGSDVIYKFKKDASLNGATIERIQLNPRGVNLRITAPATANAPTRTLTLEFSNKNNIMTVVAELGGGRTKVLGSFGTGAGAYTESKVLNKLFGDDLQRITQGGGTAADNIYAFLRSKYNLADFNQFREIFTDIVKELQNGNITDTPKYKAYSEDVQDQVDSALAILAGNIQSLYQMKQDTARRAGAAFDVIFDNEKYGQTWEKTWKPFLRDVVGVPGYLIGDVDPQFRMSNLSNLYEAIRGKAVAHGMDVAGPDYDLKYERPTTNSPLIKDLNITSTPLHEDAVEALKANNLSEALSITGKKLPGVMGRIARMLASALKNEKIEVIIHDFSDYTNRPPPLQAAISWHKNPLDLSGLYFVERGSGKRFLALNTNQFGGGLDVWTLLHDAHHALLDSVIDNPAHPVTKQLETLFQSVKGDLGTIYGSTNLKEFMAEVRSNPEMREKLASLRYKDTTLSAWDRFKLAVGNFFRRRLGINEVNPDTALSNADRTIDAMIVGPDGIYESLAAVDIARQGGAFLDALADRVAKLPLFNEERASKIHAFISSSVPNFVRRVVLGGLPLHAFVDVAKRVLPQVESVNKLFDQRDAAEHKILESLMTVADRGSAWRDSVSAETYEKFSDLVANSTTEEVDPSHPEERYSKFWARVDLGNNKFDNVSFDNKKARDDFVKDPNNKATKSYSASVEKVQLWKDMQANWKAIGTEGQAIYKQIRDSYAKQRLEAIRLLDQRIDELAGTNVAMAEKLKKSIFSRMFERGHIDPYFSLFRKGDFWLRFDVQKANKKGVIEQNEQVFAFQTPRERDQFIEMMSKAGGYNFEKYAQVGQIKFKMRPNTKFMEEVIKTLETNKVKPEAVEEVIKMVVESMPELSYAKSFIKRKNVPGFERDPVKVFRERSRGMSRQLANMEYAPKLYSALGNMVNDVKNRYDNELARTYLDEIEQRIKFALNPKLPAASQMARGLTFTWTLGFNVSSALADMMQIPMVTLPYLGKYGMKEATSAIGRASRLFVGSGLSHKTEMYVPTTDAHGNKITHVDARSMPSIDNIDFNDQNNKDLMYLKDLVQYASDNGQLNRTQLYEGLSGYEPVDFSKGVSRAIKENGVLNFVNAASGFMFHHSGRMNRQVTLVAGYELELRRLMDENAATKGKGLNESTAEQRAKAAQEAVKVAEFTQGGASSASAPRWSQNALGSLLFMFKRYGVTMYYLQFKMLREAFAQKRPTDVSDKEWKMAKSAAKRQIAGTLGMAALLAGAQGLPGMGLIATLYNMFFKDDDDDTMEEAMRKHLNEGVYSGALNALTGSEWATRIGLSNLMFRTPKAADDKATLTQQAGELLGGPVLGMVERVNRGLKDIGDGHVERGVEQMLPVAIANGMKAVRFSSEGALTKRGDAVVPSVHPIQVGLQAIGFAPADYVRQLEINADIKSFERETLQRRSELMRKYYVAWRSGDGAEMGHIYEKIAKFNEKQPSNPITPKVLQQSMKDHMKTSMNMVGGVTLNQKMRSQLLQMEHAYGSDSVWYK